MKQNGVFFKVLNLVDHMLGDWWFATTIETAYFMFLSLESSVQMKHYRILGGRFSFFSEVYMPLETSTALNTFFNKLKSAFYPLFKLQVVDCLLKDDLICSCTQSCLEKAGHQRGRCFQSQGLPGWETLVRACGPMAVRRWGPAFTPVCVSVLAPGEMKNRYEFTAPIASMGF